MKIDVKFSVSLQTFEVGFEQSLQAVEVGFEHSQVVTAAPEYDYYSGAYEVTPRASRQVLETGQKIMTDDLVVKGIPYAEVTNLADGLTVTIGEVEPPDKPRIVIIDDTDGQLLVSGLTVTDDSHGSLTVTGAVTLDDNGGNIVIGG